MGSPEVPRLELAFWRSLGSGLNRGPGHKGERRRVQGKGVLTEGSVIWGGASGERLGSLGRGPALAGSGEGMGDPGGWRTLKTEFPGSGRASGRRLGSLGTGAAGDGGPGADSPLLPQYRPGSRVGSSAPRVTPPAPFRVPIQGQPPLALSPGAVQGLPAAAAARRMSWSPAGWGSGPGGQMPWGHSRDGWRGASAGGDARITPSSSASEPGDTCRGTVQKGDSALPPHLITPGRQVGRLSPWSHGETRLSWDLTESSNHDVTLIPQTRELEVQP